VSLARKTAIALLFGTAAVLTLRTNALVAPVQPRQHPLSAAAWRSAPGDYRVAADHIVGIDAFIGDNGERMLLFSDYQTGTVRRLFPTSGADYDAGPGFSQRSPIAFRVQFIEGQEHEHPSALRIVTATGQTTIAARLPVEEQNVTFRSGHAVLAGTILRSRSPATVAGIVLLHGSGPLTRYSFGPYPHFFASLGLAVLVYDKRGAGQSNGDGMTASDYYPQPYTDDAVAAVRFLQSQPGIRQASVGTWGSSEGGMLSTQLCARRPEPAFAINSSGFMEPLWQQMLYSIEAELEADGFSKPDANEARALRQLQFDVGRTGSNWASLNKRQLSDRTRPWFDRYFEATTPSASVLRWRWQHVYSFDPLVALASARCPILGLFGSLDTSTPAKTSADTMRRALRPSGGIRVEIEVFPNAGHPLAEVKSAATSALEASPGMAPGVFSSIRNFILESTPHHGERSATKGRESVPNTTHAQTSHPAPL